MQQVYDYDRGKLDEMVSTSESIREQKAQLEKEQKTLQASQDDLTSKQSLLYTTIQESEKKVKDFDSQLSKAVAAAAARSAAASASSVKSTYVSTGDTSVGAAIVRKAYEYLGTPYRSGGAAPGDLTVQAIHHMYLGSLESGCHVQAVHRHMEVRM